jgi:hypothetical protein
VRSSDDGIDVISFSIEGEEVHLKEEVGPIAESFSSIKDEPEVSPQTFRRYVSLPSLIMPFCLSAFLHKSAPYVEWKWSIHIYGVLNMRVE